MQPDRHAQSSKYAEDRGLPGAFDGETVNRRRFMNLTAQGAGGIAVAAMALPALGFAVGPIFQRTPFQWQIIGTAADFSESTYVTKVLTIIDGEGDAGKSIAYVRLRNPKIDTEPENQFNHYVALSSRCMHLGCPVRYVQAAERFICPCHGGVYNFRGQVAGGPPVRPLDRFYTLVRPNPNAPDDSSQDLIYLGPRYSVNSQLRAFSPRDPGEPLDGIGQYLYPSRWDTSVKPPTTNLPTVPPIPGT